MSGQERLKHRFGYLRLVAADPELIQKFGHTSPVLRSARYRERLAAKAVRLDIAFIAGEQFNLPLRP